MFLNNTLSHGTVLRDELKQTRANVPCHIQQSTCEICMQQSTVGEVFERSSEENYKGELSIYPGLVA